MSALSGVRVLDLSVGIAGPIVGMFLGDFGADVVRVEGTAGDPQSSSSGYAVWNRNKRSLRVDPMDRAHLDWLTQSVAAADVVILGADAELSDWGHQVAEQGARNGELVTVRLPAYLDSDPAWIGGESNHILAGIAGQAMRQSSVKGGPVASMSPFISYIHGIWRRCVQSPRSSSARSPALVRLLLSRGFKRSSSNCRFAYRQSGRTGSGHRDRRDGSAPYLQALRLRRRFVDVGGCTRI